MSTPELDGPDRSRVGSQAQFSWTRPSWDANADVTTSDLIGYHFSPGELAQIRYTDPVVAPIMRSLRSSVQAFEWRVRAAEDTPEGRAASDVIQAALKSIPHFNIHLATVWDYVSWAGFVPFEVLRVPANTPLGYRWYPTLIHPTTVDRLETDSSGTVPTTLTQVTERGSTAFSPSEYVWYVNSEVPGNFFGESALRPLLVVKRASEIDLKTYIDNRLKARGIYTVQTVGEPDDKGQQEYFSLLRQLNAAIAGQAGYVGVPAWLQLDILSSPNPPDKTLDVWQYFDALKRAALGHFLENLGLSGSGSNRALGEVLQEQDRERWYAEVARFEHMLNTTGLLPALCDTYRIPHHLRPELYVHREEETLDIDVAFERLARLQDLRASGAVDDEEFAEFKARIMGTRIED